MEQCLSHTLNSGPTVAGRKPIVVGDLRGLREIYDDEGELIVEPGEKVLRMVENDDTNLWEGRRALTGRIFLGYPEQKVILYLTDERLVFIRNLQPWPIFKTHGTPFWLAVAVREALCAKNLECHCLKEFMELFYSEVETFKSKRDKWVQLELRNCNDIPITVDAAGVMTRFSYW
ncbi:MAG: hypothetical protein ACE5II_02625 [Anaerolineae bacterium]